MNTTIDYYAILGILPSAEEVVIRAAYRALAQLYHPDKYDGSPQEANEKMAIINEAYEVLSNLEKRKKYDRERGEGVSEGDTYFSDDVAPTYDPMEKDWSIAIKFYPDLHDIIYRLNKISWRLAYIYKALIIENKAFDKRHEIADTLEHQFLVLYFGENKKIIKFASNLIFEGNKKAASGLNDAVRVLGRSADPDMIINQIKKDFPKTEKTDSELMEIYGITFNGGKYKFRSFQYDNLSDAVDYASSLYQK